MEEKKYLRLILDNLDSHLNTIDSIHMHVEGIEPLTFNVNILFLGAITRLTQALFTLFELIHSINITLL